MLFEKMFIQHLSIMQECIPKTYEEALQANYELTYGDNYKYPKYEFFQNVYTKEEFDENYPFILHDLNNYYPEYDF